MATYSFRVTETRSRLGFTAQPEDPRFERVLTLDGNPAYQLGAKCWSCQFSFNRLPHADVYESDGREHDLLGPRLTRDLVERTWADLPVGEYLAMDLVEQPRLVLPGGHDDYFSEELPRSFDLQVNANEATEYYRSRSLRIGKGRALFEFIVPLASQQQLHSEVLEEYEQRWTSQRSPTIAVSLLEIHGAADWRDGFQPEFSEHWCLTHFLIDGHHRTLAAARHNRRLRLVSFLALDECLASPDDVNALMPMLRRPNPTKLEPFGTP